MSNFTKPALSLSDQLEKLRARGLTISNPLAATEFLSRVSYYRFSGYTRAFYVDADNTDSGHVFPTNTAFDEIVRLYEFDRELRLLVISAVERIEVALRTAATNHLCLRYGNTWFLDDAVFLPRFGHDAFLADLESILKLDPLTGGRREQFLEHYFRKYSVPSHPPGWMVGEVLSFSTWSKIFKNLSDLRDQKEIALQLGWPASLIESWAHCLAIMRNCCAHHSRIWNRTFAVRPTFPSKSPEFGETIWKDTSFAAQAAVIHALMGKVAPSDGWSLRLKQLLDRYPRTQAGSMGFKWKWFANPFWGIAP
ncbi:MAG TPA: Abi family protein [Opitutaceae bacterium]|nr:Abi family protein [Opitutaceae bacterium]